MERLSGETVQLVERAVGLTKYAKVVEREGRWRWKGYVLVQDPQRGGTPFLSPTMHYGPGMSGGAGWWHAFSRKRLERKLDRAIRGLRGSSERFVEVVRA